MTQLAFKAPCKCLSVVALVCSHSAHLKFLTVVLDVLMEPVCMIRGLKN